jgi:hypothetical protein
MCIGLLPPGVNPIAVHIYIISYEMNTVVNHLQRELKLEVVPLSKRNVSPLHRPAGLNLCREIRLD